MRRPVSLLLAVPACHLALASPAAAGSAAAEPSEPGVAEEGAPVPRSSEPVWQPPLDAPLPPTEPFAPGEPEPGAAPQAPEVNRISEPPQDTIASDTERPRPDYDGLSEPTTAGDVALWVPRVLLSPLYLVSEFVVRRPLGFIVTTAEEHHWPAILVDFFTFGPDRNAGIIPTGIIDFGLRPSVGVYFFWNEFLAPNNALRARAATGGHDWWWFQLTDRLEVHPGHHIALRGELSTRPDRVFTGLGPSTTDTEYRFGERWVEGGLGYTAELWASSTFESFAAVRDVRFDPRDRCCGDPSLQRALDRGVIAEPAGLADGYALFRHGLVATLDTRPSRGPEGPILGENFVAPPGSGVKLELRAEHAGGLREESGGGRVHFLRYGATLGGFVDLTARQRVIGLQLITDFADPVGDAPAIPFTELISLGGDRPLRGFLPGRLRDRSALAARFSYSWPVWVWVDGAVHYSVGNVFGEHLDGFDPELLRSSFGIGLQSTGTRDHVFEVLVAAGTETFQDGGAVENLRLVFGATSGF